MKTASWLALRACSASCRTGVALTLIALMSVLGVLALAFPGELPTRMV